MEQLLRAISNGKGAPLPLGYYLSTDAAVAPPPDGAGGGVDRLSASWNVDLAHLRIDRHTFFESVLQDATFPIFAAFLFGGTSVDQRRLDDGATALHIAAAGQLSIVPRLQSSGCNSSSCCSSSGGGQAMQRAEAAGVEKGATAASVVDGGLEIESRSTAAVLQRSCGNQLILSFLIDSGADIDATMSGADGATPLMIAAAFENKKAMMLLLTKGASLDARDRLGRSCLYYAARRPHILEALRVWMGDEVFQRRAAQDQLLHVVCRLPGTAMAALYLIEQVGINVNSSSRRGERDEEVGQQQGEHRSGSREAVLGYEESQSAKMDDGRGGGGDTAGVVVGGVVDGSVSPWKAKRESALRQSSAGPDGRVSFDEQTAGGLDPYDAEADAVYGHQGNTPLHLAVSTGDVELIRALLSKGADPHAANASGATPLHLAQSIHSASSSIIIHLKDELLMNFFPASTAAAAARRRQRERLGPCDLPSVRRLLVEYGKATTPEARASILLKGESALIQPWKACGWFDAIQLIVAATVPYLLYYGCCVFLTNFYALVCLLPLWFGYFFNAMRADATRPGCRSLRGVGWVLGSFTVHAVSLGLFTTSFYYQYYSLEFESHQALSLWLIPSFVLLGVAFLYFFFIASPGTVSSTEGQRRGIYSSIRQAKGACPKEVLFGIDLGTMVKKPLRAQYCPHLRRVVLRLDHYCPYMAVSVGGGNHRAFVWFHVALLSTLSCCYYYALAYHRIFGEMSKLVQHALQDQEILAQEGLSPIPPHIVSFTFSTPLYRFVYMFGQVVLPAQLLLVALVLYQQLSVIARNLTLFDLDHVHDESSLYCFTLGPKVYSLTDRGALRNLADFFLCTTSLTAEQHRVPPLSPYAQRQVENYQRWEVRKNDGHPRDCCGENHGAASYTHEPAAAAPAVGAEGQGGDDGDARRSRSSPSQHTSGEAVEESRAAVPMRGTSLATYIFQDMVKTGTRSVHLRHHRSVSGSTDDGIDAHTQQEWDEAVEQAVKMFEFYQASLRSSEQASLNGSERAFD